MDAQEPIVGTVEATMAKRTARWTLATHSAQRVGECRLRTQEEFWELELPERGKGKGVMLSPADGQSQLCAHLCTQAVQIPVCVDTQSHVA